VRAALLEGCEPLTPTEVALEEALGSVLAGDVVADHDLPPFANTAMDGYAVRAADTAAAPCTLEVVGTVAAGPAGGPLVGRGQAARIMTGAPLPQGADAVVMVERTRVVDGGARVEVGEAVAPGSFVRRPGEDVVAGDVVLVAGTRLGPAQLGVLASLGQHRVVVHPPAVVGVLSTGDELQVDPGPLAPGCIRDSNGPALRALVRAAGFVAVDLGTAPDDLDAIVAALEAGVAACDAVLCTGGVSVGDFDYVTAALATLGEASAWSVAVRPGKPLAHVRVGTTPVFGLPGNPVSSMVSFELFAHPVLRALSARRPAVEAPVPAVADEDLPRRRDGKLHLVRVGAQMGPDGRLRIRSAGGQGSHMLATMARADALALLPDGPGARAGDAVEVLLLDRTPPGPEGGAPRS